jgi:uncharacterized pyridoxamine 5'-phosphate oxidase family protein
MDKKEILAFITKNPVAYLATSEDNIPHVRAMGTFRADKDGIIFAMQADKNVYKQLIKNPATEICYHFESVMVRVKGQMELIKDAAIKNEIIEKRPFYKPGVAKAGLDYVGAFRVKNAKATVLDMKGPPTPAGASKVWIDL